MKWTKASRYHDESDPPGYRICWAWSGEVEKFTASRNGSPSLLLITTADKAAAKRAAMEDRNG